MKFEPLLSIIIPTHNRCKLLSKNLEALCAQDWMEDKFEVIVVADACEDDTIQTVASFSGNRRYQLEVISHKGRNAALSRNLGSSKARGRIILFLDDDIIAGPNLAKSHIASQDGNTVVLGYSKPMVPDKPSWWQIGANLWWEDCFSEMRRDDHRFGYRDFCAGNVSMSRNLFFEAGKFDETFCGRLEDYELGLRLLKMGAKFRFAPEALGFHFENTNLQTWLFRIWQDGIGDMKIGERHPEMRNEIFAGFDTPPEPWPKTRKIIRRLAFSMPQNGNRIKRLLLKTALFCEYMKFRGFYQRIVNALREHQYWSGVASKIGNWHSMYSWLQEGPYPQPVAFDAPVVDLVQQEVLNIPDEILERANVLGLRLTINGSEILTIPVVPGCEPITRKHIDRYLYESMKNRFLPEFAYHMICSAEGGNLKFLYNSLT